MKLLTFFICSLPCILFANPQAPAVVAGEATFNQPNPRTLEIATSGRAIINWQEFSIKQGEIASFIQSGRNSAVLNRVIGNMQSQIDGLLKSNGNVYLINPQGVVIGKEGLIQTAGFVGSAFDVLDESFLKNQQLHFKGDSNAAIINYGTIEALDGDVILLGRSVINHGKINALNGEVDLAAGYEILLKPEGEDRIFISLSNNSTEKNEVGIEQTGYIQSVAAYLKAEGNAYALAIKQSGQIEANAILEKEGRIYLVAEKGVNEISGTLTAASGKIQLLGDKVGILNGSVIDVSGDLGGGEVLIGGDFQGKESTIANATLSVVEENVLIAAGAKKAGNGGKVIVWSDEATSFSGNIQAEGGMDGGDGGFVEVSGKQHLNFAGLVSTMAPHGKMGTLLLDPTDVTVSTAADMNNSFSGGNYTYTSATANINNTTLVANLMTTNVTISTASIFLTAPNGGSILVSAPINWSSGSSLEFIANNNITLNIVGTTPGIAAINNSSSGGIAFTAQNNIFVQGTDNVTSPVVAVNTGPLSFNTQAGNIIFQPTAATFVSVNAGAGNFSISAAQDLQLIAGFASNVFIFSSSGGFNLFSAGRDLLLQGGSAISENVQISVPPNVVTLLEFTNVGRNVLISGNVGYAEVGGIPPFATGNAVGNISFDNVGGNFTLQGGALGGFAQVGHAIDNLLNTTMAATGNVSVNVAGTLSLLGGSGDAAIIGMGSLTPGAVVNETLEGNISAKANIVQLTGGSGSSGVALIGFVSNAPTSNGVLGQVNVTATSDIFLQTSSLGDAVIGYLQTANIATSSVGLPINIFANGVLQMDASGAGAAFIANNLGNMSAPFNVNIEVKNALIGTGSGLPLHVTIYSAQDLIFKTEQSMHLGHSSQVFSLGGQVSLVVDNQFPRRPGIGDGQFILDPGAIVSTAGPLRIFTAVRQQNSINAPINGVLFVPGPLFLDSAEEQWKTYFFDPFGGFPFTIFYKDGLPAYQNAYGIAISEALRDLTPYDELIFVRIPFCLRYDRCNVRFETYPKSALSGYDFAYDEGYDILRRQYRNYNTKYAESL